jgi:hypothetical protein
MKTCKEIHPNNKINIGFTCCGNAYTDFQQKDYSLDKLVEIIDKNSNGLFLGLAPFEMYGIKRDNQFEGYGRATECNEIPYHAFIKKEFSGDTRDYTSSDYRTLKEALTWLAFHLQRLNEISSQTKGNKE